MSYGQAFLLMFLGAATGILVDVIGTGLQVDWALRTIVAFLVSFLVGWVIAASASRDGR